MILIPGNLYMGIDPGGSGAIAIISDQAGVMPLVYDIPVMTVKKSRGNKTAFNNPAIVDLFKDLGRNKSRVRGVCLEVAQVQVFGKASAATYTAFRVGCGYGMWPLFLAAWGYYVEEVAPITWKSKMGLRKADKETSRFKALQLFPRADIKRKKDHNRAEALLLAEYLRRKMGGS